MKNDKWPGEVFICTGSAVLPLTRISLSRPASANGVAHTARGLCIWVSLPPEQPFSSPWHREPTGQGGGMKRSHAPFFFISAISVGARGYLYLLFVRD